MDRKVYHIVDPDTGEVVAEKRMGRVQLEYYKALASGKLKTVFFRIALICYFLTMLLGLAIFFVSDDWKWLAAILFVISFLVFGLITNIYNHAEKEAEDKKTPSCKKLRDK